MNLALGIPCIENVPGQAFGYHLLVAGEMARFGTLHVLAPYNLIPHDTARIAIVDQAMEHGCDYLMFVDDDMITPVGSFTKLYEIMKERKPVVVSGYYVRRGYPPTCVWSRKVGDGFVQVDARSGVHEIHVSGLGCALIDLKWVSENLEKPYFRMTPSDTGTQVTDDTTFFEQVMEKGGLVLGCADVRSGHLGERIVFGVETQDTLGKRFVKEMIDGDVCNGDDVEGGQGAATEAAEEEG